jgi:hypothetical protein
MSEALWNLGALSIGSGVLTVLAAFSFAIYLVLTGPSAKRPH